jgi:3-deoxy-D-manno-octulosonic acid kinase
VQSLSTVLSTAARDTGFWSGLGEGIFEFHDAGVYHADMNAYNLQIDEQDRLWMLDFDKGRLRSPGTWQQQTLERLHRSLRKIQAMDPELHFRQEDWEALLDGYFNASRSA